MYSEFTEAALTDGAAWGRLADSVAVEVRRHGAPRPVQRALVAKAVAPDAVGAPASLPAQIPPSAKIVATTAPPPEVAARGVGVSSVREMSSVRA